MSEPLKLSGEGLDLRHHAEKRVARYLGDVPLTTGWYAGLGKDGIMYWHFGWRGISAMDDGDGIDLETVIPACKGISVMMPSWHGPFADPQIDDYPLNNVCTECAANQETTG